MPDHGKQRLKSPRLAPNNRRNVCKSTTPTPTQNIMRNVACSYNLLCLELHELHIYYFCQTATLFQRKKRNAISLVQLEEHPLYDLKKLCEVSSVEVC